MRHRCSSEFNRLNSTDLASVVEMIIREHVLNNMVSPTLKLMIKIDGRPYDFGVCMLFVMESLYVLIINFSCFDIDRHCVIDNDLNSR